MTTTAARRVIAIEDHYRRAGPHGHPDVVAAALDWAMTPKDRATWKALVTQYEARLGPHPESLSPDDLDPADYATLLRIMVRAYAVLGWPIRADATISDPTRPAAPCR